MSTRSERVRCLVLLASLLASSCAGLDRSDQGRLQPQTVSGPCQVEKFFILAFTSVRTDMTVGNAGQACSFTLFDLNEQRVLTAAFVTGQPAHGRATVGLVTANRQAVVSYIPEPGYVGPDRFSITLEPNARGVTVAVVVQPSPPTP